MDLSRGIAGTVIVLTAVVPISNAAGETAEFDSSFEGFETKVRAAVSRTTPQTSSSVELDADDVATASTRTAEDAIRLVPGFVLVQHGSEGKGYQYFVRGFDALHGADIEMRIAGVPFNEWSNVHATGYVDLTLVPPETLSKIEVTKGPFSIDQGPFALAGSIQYDLGVAARNRGARATYTVGTTNRHRLLVSYAPVEPDNPNYLTAEVLVDGGFGQGRAARRAGATGRYRLYDDRESSLEFWAAAGVSRFDLPGIVRLDDVNAGRIELRDSYGDGEWEGESQRGVLSLSYEHRDGSASSRAQVYAMARSLRLNENFTGFLNDPINGDAFLQRHRSAAIGTSLEHFRELGGTLALMVNGSAHGEYVAQSEDQVDPSGAPIETTRDVGGVQTAWHGGAAIRFLPSRSIRVDVGGRIDGVTTFNVKDSIDGERGRGVRIVLSPRTALRYRASDSIEFFAAYGRGLRPPELGAFVQVDPGPTGLEGASAPQAEPTVNDSIEVGARSDLFEVLSLSISAFGTFIERESVFDHVAGTSVELGATQRLGVETTTTLEVTSRVELRADATWVDAQFRDSGDPVPFAPNLVLGTHAVMRPVDGWFGGLHAVIVAPRDLPFGGQSEWLWITSAVAGYDWEHFRAEVAVDNLLDQNSHEGAYQFASVWPPSGDALPSEHVAPGPPLSARFTLSAAF